MQSYYESFAVRSDDREKLQCIPIKKKQNK